MFLIKWDERLAKYVYTYDEKDIVIYIFADFMYLYTYVFLYIVDPCNTKLQKQIESAWTKRRKNWIEETIHEGDDDIVKIP